MAARSKRIAKAREAMSDLKERLAATIKGASFQRNGDYLLVNERGLSNALSHLIESELQAASQQACAMVLEKAANVVEQCNREGPYQAIAAAPRIRELIPEARAEAIREAQTDMRHLMFPDGDDPETDDMAEVVDAFRNHYEERLVTPLKKQCDRHWTDETPEQVVMIACNAIYWRTDAARDDEREKWQAQISALLGALRLAKDALEEMDALFDGDGLHEQYQDQASVALEQTKAALAAVRKVLE